MYFMKVMKTELVDSDAKFGGKGNLFIQQYIISFYKKIKL